MKKTLFLSLVLLVGLSAYAQRAIVKDPGLMEGKAVLNRERLGKDAQTEPFAFVPSVAVPVVSTREADHLEADIMTTTYDLQSNNLVCNRMYRFDDGTVGATATWSAMTSGFSDRGTGYNYFNGQEWQDQPSARLENVKTGWPSYAQYGDNGEIVVAHTGTDLVFMTRETKGEGEWSELRHIPNPEHLGLVGEAKDLTWPRVVCSGEHHDIIHVACASQASENSVTVPRTFYCRSTDGGETWEVGFVPLMQDYEMNEFSADDYQIAAQGSTVAVMYQGSMGCDVFVIKSEDNGETWERLEVWENPYAGLDWETDTASLFTDTLYAPEQCSMALDPYGRVHVVMSVKEMIHDELGTTYSFFYGAQVDGVIYWTESMGGPVVDRVHDEYPATSHYHDANPHHALKLWWPVPNDPGYIYRDTTHVWVGCLPDLSDWQQDNYYLEKCYYQYWSCLCAQPTITIDRNLTIAVAYHCPDLERMLANGVYYRRGVRVSYMENGIVFRNEDNLADNELYIMHMMDECINTTAVQNTDNNEFWFGFTTDGTPGFSTIPSNGVHDVTDNTFYVVRITPNYDGMAVQEQVNPMNSVSVYPNPVSDNLYINVNASQASRMDIAVYSVTGQKVMETSANVGAGISVPSINVGHLSSGVYFVTVSANGFEETMKFVVR